MLHRSKGQASLCVILKDNTGEVSEIDSLQGETTLSSLWYDDMSAQ